MDLEYDVLDILENLRAYIKDGDVESIEETISNTDPVKLVEILNRLEPEERIRILPYIDLLSISKYINKLDDSVIREIEAYKGIDEIVELLNWMPLDEAVDLLQRLSPKTVNQVLRSLSGNRAKDIAELLKYSPESVGGVMTIRVPVFRAGLTVGEVLEEYVKRNMIGYYDRHNYIYIVNDENKLVGWVDTKTILMVDRRRLINDIVSKPPAYVYPDMDREEAARVAVKYDLVEIPVLDKDNKFLGIVTLDDVLDIAVFELSEDLMRFGGFLEAVRVSYVGSSIKSMVKRRAPPILLIYLMDSITGGIVASFTQLIERVAILASFLPMLADNSGNIGSQSSTLIIRGIALGELKPGDIFTIIRKEFLTTLLMSMILLPAAFAISFTITYLAGYSLHTSLIIGASVSVALLMSMLVTDIIGATLPIMLAKIKIDPASVSAPLITTIGDIVTALTYFITALVLTSTYAPV